VSGVVAALTAQAQLNADQPGVGSALNSFRADPLNQLLLRITITLVPPAAEPNSDHPGWASALNGFGADRLNQVLLLITITLVTLAAVNAIFITWATALDARRSSALARAPGATPQQVSAGLSAAQVLPALAGAALGIPGGIALFAATSDTDTIAPPLWQLLAVVPGTVLVVAALTR